MKQKLTLSKESAFNATEELYYMVGKSKFALMVLPLTLLGFIGVWSEISVDQ